MNEATETTVPETTPEPQVKDPGAVLAKNKELLSRNSKLGEDLSAAQARVAELEVQIQSSAAEHEELKSKFSDFHIRRPLARLAEEISDVPDLWTTEFLKHYEVKATGDDLGIFKNGQRCVLAKGKIGAGEPYKFTSQDIWALLAFDVEDTGTPEVRRWRGLMNYFGPSGSGARGSTHSTYTPPKPEPANAGADSTTKPQYGLR